MTPCCRHEATTCILGDQCWHFSPTADNASLALALPPRAVVSSSASVSLQLGHAPSRQHLKVWGYSHDTMPSP